MSETIRVPRDGGTCDAALFLPAGAAAAPLVVQYMDAGGLRPAMAAMAEPLVAAGYAVLQPNLYWRSGPFAPFDFATVWTDPDERARIGALMNGFTPEQAMADTAALLEVVGRDPRIRADRLAFVGYCMGGRMTLFAAAAFGPRVAAAAAVHGGGLVTAAANSPHLGAPKITGELYFAVAGEDRSCTAQDCDTLAAALSAAGVRHTLEHFPAARHGWAMTDFPVFDATAAERQWAAVLALFRRALPTGR